MKKKIILWGTLALALLLAVGVFSVYQGYKNTLDNMHVGEDEEDDRPKETEKELEEKFKDPFAVLLYGIDQREDSSDGGRPDTLMLALIDSNDKKVNLVSIPRDSLVDIPGRSQNKINHSFSYGGVQLTMQTIEEWLNIPLYGYVAIDFKGFEELVDIVGGVDVYVDRTIQYDDPMDGTHIRLEEGQQVLDGKNALDFVRARLDNRGSRYYTSDYQRMERQQLVLKELGREIVSLSSLPRVFSMMNAVGDNVSTSLTPDELDFLVRSFYNFNMSNLETTSIEGEGRTINGVSFEVVPQEEVDRINEHATNFINRIPTPIKTENDATDTEDPTGEASEDGNVAADGNRG
ncbi:LCP family protein [Bacillus horti]|uniref:LCP family protein required for cell wall assembly n=1 Tax=Caldalkalibacillus horti TaxID=77523 RepID=A0ABT9VZG0_9BACI|nr:LCP family protein [Bacillus horti]MDQ0166386.1 LCP family protein required for cell wall assembly [Bacillus horti]